MDVHVYRLNVPPHLLLMQAQKMYVDSNSSPLVLALQLAQAVGNGSIVDLMFSSNTASAAVQAMVREQADALMHTHIHRGKTHTERNMHTRTQTHHTHTNTHTHTHTYTYTGLRTQQPHLLGPGPGPPSPAPRQQCRQQQQTSQCAVLRGKSHSHCIAAAGGVCQSPFLLALLMCVVWLRVVCCLTLVWLRVVEVGRCCRNEKLRVEVGVRLGVSHLRFRSHTTL
jgi:hypothetical protein